MILMYNIITIQYHNNNISWGLPITNNATTITDSNSNSIIAPLSGQGSSTTALSNTGFHSISTPSIHSESLASGSTNLALFDKGKSPIVMGKIQINGHDRFSLRDGKYFNFLQPYQHHTNIPLSIHGIHVYSFALKPEEHQPSGTLNMSRIDTASLSLKCETGGTVKVYAVNYNVLRILSGMGGLAYSN